MYLYVFFLTLVRGIVFRNMHCRKALRARADLNLPPLALRALFAASRVRCLRSWRRSCTNAPTTPARSSPPIWCVSLRLFVCKQRALLLTWVFFFSFAMKEATRDYVRLVDVHARLQSIFEKLAVCMRSNIRQLGSYYRVTFFGTAFAELDGS